MFSQALPLITVPPRIILPSIFLVVINKVSWRAILTLLKHLVDSNCFGIYQTMSDFFFWSITLAILLFLLVLIWQLADHGLINGNTVM